MCVYYAQMPSNYKSPDIAILIGKEIKSARQLANLTLLDLENSLSIHHSQISRIERGAFLRPSKNVQVLCNSFAIDWRGPSSQRESLIARLERAATGPPHLRRMLSTFLDALDAAQRGHGGHA
jgi:transcriptional regulator with XRE-family HTH domain